ncbi:MAG: VOC family protein [Myxococcota bacterium]|nr:VOC family protein [Myxococcota bacterium]
MPDIQRLGTLGFEVSDVDAWERFAVDVLGLQAAARRPDGSLALRMDERAQRIVLHPGPADDLAYLGFEVDDEAALGGIARQLAGDGVPVTEAKPETVEARGVTALWHCEDPSGIPIELSCGAAVANEPFRSERVPSGFVTGDEGVGHVVICAKDIDATDRFYRERLGMRLSDRIEGEVVPGVDVEIRFLHANPRHHTIAFASLPMPKRMHHFMIQANEMDQVGHAYDRALDAGVPIANTLGQHPNDRMFSFYALTPSGFLVEFGWGGVRIDDATWDASAVYDRLSTWGHRPPAAAGG